MSEVAARAAMNRMNLREVALAAQFASNLESDLSLMARADAEVEAAKFMDRRADMCEAFGFKAVQQDKPFAFANGIAIIPIQGSLINRFGGSYGYVTGYNFVRRQLALAMADDDVKAIVYDVNSYGGEVSGCFELGDDMYAARSIKPSVAVVDANAFSAGYALASSAGKIVLTPSGGAGSIGVLAMHMDVSKALESFGVKVTFIHFGDHKVDGNMYEPLSKEVKADIQKGVDASGAKFVAFVARNRSIDPQVVKDTQARTYRAEEALSLGLIDTIAAPDKAVQVLFDELSGSVSTTAKKDDQMTIAATQPGAPDQATQDAAAAATQAAALKAASDKAAADARVAERARVSGITGCEEAKGRTGLANHIAMNTDMPVDEAKAMLAAAPAEQTAAAGASAFVAAMEQTGNPNVGNAADGGTGQPGANAELEAANRILGAQTAVTGAKFELVK